MSCNGSRLIHFPPPLYPLPRTHWLLHTAAGDPFTFHSQTHKHRRMGTHWTNCWSREVLHQTFCVSCYQRTTFINIIHHTQKLLHTSHYNVKHTQIQVLKAQWTPKWKFCHNLFIKPRKGFGSIDFRSILAHNNIIQNSFFCLFHRRK